VRIAVAGKGGAGKTTISATLARLVARERTVVAIDADSNPNLAAALGVPPGALPGSAVLPTGLVSRRLDGPALRDDVEAVLASHAVTAPGGVRVVLMGAPAHAGEGCLCSAHATVSALLADLGERPDVVTVMDVEASPEHLSRGTARHVDALLLVTEPYYRSLETVRLLAGLARELPIPRLGVVANKVRSDSDAEAVEAFCERHDLELLARIPRSEAVVDADVAGVPVVEHGATEFVAAVGALAERVLGVSAAPSAPR
jgi:CO dehydrogenase maturation factor